MRSVSLLGLAFLIVYSFCIFKANAHPEKVDYHPAICQRLGAAGAGGSGLQYNLYTVTAMNGDVNIICPLMLVTGSDDNPSDDASASTVTVNFAARVVGMNTALSTNCELRSESTSVVASIPSFPFGSGSIAGTGTLALPVTSTSPTPLVPTGFHFYCQPLRQNFQLGSIEVQVQP
jgi:hypothetical protein